MNDSMEIPEPYSPGMPVQIIAGSIPYVAVGIGLYVFSNAWLTIALYYVGVIVYIIAFGREELRRSLPGGLNRKLLLISALIFSQAGVAIFLLWPHSVLPGVNLTDFLNNTGLGQWRFAVFATMFCLLNPVMEEIFWRGCFASNPHKPSWTDAGYAGYHVPVALMVADVSLSITAFSVLFFTGWFLRYLRYKSNGLTMGILAHLIADISIMGGLWFVLQSEGFV